MPVGTLKPQVDPAAHPIIAKLISLLGGERQLPMSPAIMGSIAPGPALGVASAPLSHIPLTPGAPDSAEYLSDVVKNGIPGAMKSLGGYVKDTATHEGSQLMNLVDTLAAHYYGKGPPK